MARRETTIPANERILATALALFKERGLAGVSTRDVSEASGLSRSHLYHYFADWNALRNGVFTALAAKETGEMSQAVDALPPARAIMLFIDQLLPSNRDSSWMLWLDAWDEALHDDEFAKIYLDAMQQWEAVLATIVKRGVAMKVFSCDTPKRATKNLFTLINGYAADLLLAPSPKAKKVAMRDVSAVAAMLLQAKL